MAPPTHADHICMRICLDERRYVCVSVRQTDSWTDTWTDVGIRREPGSWTRLRSDSWTQNSCSATAYRKTLSQILIDEIWVLLPSWIKFCIQGQLQQRKGNDARSPPKTFDNPPLVPHTATLSKTSHPELDHSHCPGLQFPCPKLFKLSIQRPFSCLFLWLRFPIFIFTFYFSFNFNDALWKM